MKKGFILVILFLTSINFLRSDPAEEITKYFDGRKIEEIVVENVNGSIELRKWDKQEIYVYAKKLSRSQAILERTDVIIEETSGKLRIQVRKKDKWRIFDGSIANIEIIVKTPSPKDISLSTVNGSLMVYDMEGSLHLSSVNGDIEVSDHKGNIEFETVNGEVNVCRAFGELKGETVNGGIEVKSLKIGDFVELKTVNGSVKLEIEEIENVEVKAETVNGSIRVDEFRKPLKNFTLRKRSINFVLGDGSKKIKLETVNGSIKIGF